MEESEPSSFLFLEQAFQILMWYVNIWDFVGPGWGKGALFLIHIK